MKIYTASIIVFSPQTKEKDQPNAIIHQIAALIPAESIEKAAESAKDTAFSRFKESEGWYGHQAVVFNITREFYQAAEEAKAAGVVAFSDAEERKFFDFDSGLDSEFLS